MAMRQVVRAVDETDGIRVRVRVEDFHQKCPIACLVQAFKH